MSTRSFLAKVGLLLLVVALASVSLTMGSTPTLASHAGGVDNMSVDMDPGAAPANTTTSVGSVEVCARINENDIADADEDSVDTLDVDIVVGPIGVPASNPLLAYQFILEYAAASLNVTASDPNFLLAATPGSAIFDASEPVPESDGALEGGAADFGGAVAADVAETGPGVLQRLGLSTVQAAAPGVYELVLDNGNAATVDLNGDALVPDNINDGHVAIDQPCPPPADLEVTSVGVSAPATAPAGSAFDVTVDGTVVNNGPATPVNADVTVSLSVPADCTVEPVDAALQDLGLALNTPFDLPSQVFAVTCANPSFHDFSAAVRVVEDDPGALESGVANNSLGSSSNTAVLATADLEIVGVSVTAPSAVALGTPFFVQATVDYRNNGSFGPVNNFVVNGTFLTLPVGCTSPIAFQTWGVAAVPTSTPFSLSFYFAVTCTQILTHTFTVTFEAHLEHLHVTDPNSANDVRIGQAPLATVIGPASLPRGGGPASALAEADRNVVAAVTLLAGLIAGLAIRRTLRRRTPW